MAPKENRITAKGMKKGGSITKAKGASKKERRKAPRFYFKLPMNYYRSRNKDNFGGIVGNASEGGVQVHLPEKLQTGELLKIEILFAKGWELKTVQGIAKIIWSDLAVRRSRKIHRYGLQFQVINKKNIRKLGILLKEASRKG